MYLFWTSSKRAKHIVEKLFKSSQQAHTNHSSSLLKVYVLLNDKTQGSQSFVLHITNISSFIEVKSAMYSKYLVILWIPLIKNSWGGEKGGYVIIKNLVYVVEIGAPSGKSPHMSVPLHSSTIHRTRNEDMVKEAISKSVEEPRVKLWGLSLRWDL